MLLIAGCSGGSEPRAPADVSTATVEASAYRSRDDDARGGRFQVTVTNAAETTITLQTVQFRSPAFAETPASERQLSMGPGARLDVPVTFGAADCAVSVQPVEATITYLDASGARISATVPLAQPYEIIDRIHSEECAAQRFSERIGMTFSVEVVVPAEAATDAAPGGDPSGGDRPGGAAAGSAGSGGFPQLPATLVVHRVDQSEEVPIRIDEVAGSVVWNVVPDPAEPLPVTLPADAAQVQVPLLIGPATCADHVVADSKKPFVFPVWIAFGAGPPEYARIPVDDATRSELSQFLGNFCNSR